MSGGSCPNRMRGSSGRPNSLQNIARPPISQHAWTDRKVAHIFDHDQLSNTNVTRLKPGVIGSTARPSEIQLGSALRILSLETLADPRRVATANCMDTDDVPFD